MMVEAGGTEKAWDLYQDGTPFVTEEVIAGGLEAAKTWIRESIDAQRELVAKATQAGLIHALEWEPQVDYADEIAARVEAVGTESLTEGRRHHRQGRARGRPGRGRQGHHRRRCCPSSPSSSARSTTRPRRC